MKFPAVKAASNQLDACLAEAVGRRLFQDLTVEEPAGEEDELHFVRLVHWAYVLINEAAAVPLKHLFSLVRISGSDGIARAGGARQAVHVLRTTIAHNLASDEQGRDKIRRSQVWMTENGGEPVNWKMCCEALCGQLIDMLTICESAWLRAVEQPEDRATAVAQLIDAVERSWPPSRFDELVRSAVSELGLEGFDVAAYRDARIDDWRSLANFFIDRQSAEAGLTRAIRSELATRFGANH